MGFFESRPGFLAPRLFARQHDGTIAVFITLDKKLNNIAGLHFGLLARGGEFLERHAAFAFQADINNGEVAVNANNATGHDRAGKTRIRAKRGIEKCGKILHASIGEAGGSSHAVYVSCRRRRSGDWVCALPPAGEARLGPGAMR